MAPCPAAGDGDFSPAFKGVEVGAAVSGAVSRDISEGTVGLAGG